MSLLLLLALVSPSADAKPKAASAPPAAAAAPAAAPAIDPALEADIRAFVVASGSAALGRQMFDAMLTNMAQALPQVPPEIWESAKAEFQPDEFTALLIPVYARHYTRSEIQQLTAFYQSPLGQKVVATNPAVVQDSMEVGQIWGQQIAQRVMAKLQAASPQ